MVIHYLLLLAQALLVAARNDSDYPYDYRDYMGSGSSSWYAVGTLFVIILLVCVVWAVSWWPPIDEPPKPQILVRIVGGKDGQPQVVQGPDGEYYVKNGD